MYSKIFQQIFQSSIASNYEVRHIFMDLLVLANKDGVIDMTYEAIARQIGVPIEKVINAITELMKPDQESRSPGFEGARLVLLDPHRIWGWRVINYKKYRERQYDDTDKRRAYKRDWMREKRAKDRGQVWTSVDKCGQAWTSVYKCGQVWKSVENAKSQEPHEQQLAKSTVDTVDTCGRKAEAEAEAYICPLPSPNGGQPEAVSASLIKDFEEAKREICLRILGGKNPSRPWGYDATEALSRQLPIPKLEIERIAWYRGLPDDGSPELARRSPLISENALMSYWSDEFTRANMLWNKWHGWEEDLK